MLPAHYLELIMLVFHCLRLDNWCVIVDAVNLGMCLVSLVYREQFYIWFLGGIVYCKLFMVENFCVFRGSFDNRETFTVNFSIRVIKWRYTILRHARKIRVICLSPVHLIR